MVYTSGLQSLEQSKTAAQPRQRYIRDGTDAVLRAGEWEVGSTYLLAILAVRW